ncbi:hypothetical protein PL75_04005 [Neisseria arctica]|uniref:Uncharacterized protein n=1 Tax=Neisseria arctica TaxID=1470200 RepID=A0A0J0YTE7_9NEIS|nr:hypothetical protein PL75_04005 [Neisseria arctica]
MYQPIEKGRLKFQTAYRCNAFPVFVSRLKAKGKPIKLILIAIMRKLAVIAFTLLQNGQDFQPSRYQ